MTNSNLFLALGSSKKNFTSSANKKTSRTPMPTNITTSYRNILQESIANVLRPPVRNTNNFPSKNQQIIRGDANGDGVIDKKDESLFVARMFAELDGKGNSVKINMKNADFSGDGKITPEDYSEFLHVYYQQQKNGNKTLKGDANGDGKVDIKDADLIELRTIGLADESNFDMNAADMDGDGEITLTDVSKINKLIKENESNVKTLQGDSNGDGSVNESDYKNIDDYLSGKKSNENFIRKNSDVSGDGIVDEQDLKGVRNLLNGRPIDWDESRLGDANGDGKINAKDADLISLTSIGLLGKNVKFDMNYADFDNDGEITPIDVARVNLLVNEKEKSVKTLQGDSNGDGKVDETDYKNIDDYLSGKESNEDFIRKNSDINGDGNVNEKDLQGVRNILDGRKIDWDESKRRLGDVNGDGKIDMDDATTITNHFHGIVQKKDFYWDNADVNHDGNIDLVDAVRIKKFFNGEISSIDQEIFKVNPPFEKAVITVDSDVYSDFYFIDKNNRILNGDIVKVIGKSSDNTALEIAFTNAEGGESTGWISVNNLKEYVSPPPPPPVPVRPTKTSDVGIDMIKGFEGFKDSAYLLPGEKYYTIGYGHTGSDVAANMKISKAQAEEFLRQDLKKAEDAVNRYCAHFQLNQNQFDALVSFTFNCGEKNLNKLLHGESGNENRPLEELPEHMPYYRLDATKKISNGLVKRRAAEVELFNTPVNYVPPTPNPITEVDPPFTSGRVKFKEEVFGDLTLTWKVNANEEVWEGDTVRVTGMRSDGKALKIVYSSVYGGEKERWVSADAVEEVKVLEPLQKLIDKWNGKTWKDHTYLPNVRQCKEFAAYIFDQLYHTGYVGSGSTSSNYYNWRLNNIPSSIYQVAEVPQTNNATQAKQAFQNLFQQAKPGDFIQIKRGSGGAHSAIFVGYSENGVQWLDANADNKNGIKLQTYSWDDLVKTTSSGKQWNVAMSIYRAK